MRKKSRPAPARPLCYVIPDPARDIVGRTRDQLLLLARLSHACVLHGDKDLELSANALVTIFQRMYMDLESAMCEMRQRRCDPA